MSNYSYKSKLVPYEKSLEFLYIEISKEWDFELNKMAPKDVYSKSSLIARWVCKESHHYKMKISERTSKNKGCPYCAGKKPIIGVNDLKSIIPNIEDFWNFKKNKTKPEDYTIGSGVKVWWLSKNCSHTWDSAIRYFVSKSQKCPYCENIRLLRGFNDLETRCKSLLKDWDFKKNTVNPKDIKFNSNSYVYWCCSSCSFEWKTRLSRRSIEGTDCKDCYRNSKFSKVEKEVFESIKELTNFVVENSNSSIIWPYEIDIYIDELKIGFEFNGDYWHSDEMLLKKTKMTALEYHSMKFKKAKASGVDLYFIWESDWRNNRAAVISEVCKVLSGDFSDNEILLLSEFSKG